MNPRILLPLLLTFALAGCVKLGFAAANLPALFSQTEATRDVLFSTVPALKLDVFVPKKKLETPRDVLVFFYGGRWQSGEKADYEFVADTFANKGYIVVIPDYHKYPAVKFPAFVEDAAAAVKWTRENISKFGGNPARIHVAGHSAGAHLASLVTADERYGVSAFIKSMAGLAGPYDFVPDEPDLMDMFGPPANYPNMNAVTFIDGTEPPMLLLHGSKDDTVKISNLERLAAKIRAEGGRVETKIYQGVDHMWIAGALSWLGHNKPDVASDMDAFFRKTP